METPKSHLEQVESHIVVAGNFQRACDQMISWLTTSNLRREQIISISANETTTVDADAVLVVVYKKHQDPDMTQMLTGLQYHLIKNTVDWDQQYEEFKEILSQSCEVVALTHTARNIGQINI
jgi:ABC-type taurine transport system substrate-binding protein